jgi:acyl-CoA synthetase (AMP-forming)/AMP-acid ligase II
VEKNFADVFEVVADAVPDREAVVCGDRRLSYAGLEERANRLAHHLSAASVGPGDHVACYLPNGPEYLEAMLAAHKLRAATVNVNWRYVADELRYLLTDSDAKAIVYDTRFAPILAKVVDDLPLLGTRLVVGADGDPAPFPGAGVSPFDEVPGATGYEEALAGSSPERSFPTRSGKDLYVLYTGGTTGMPKGVLWHQAEILSGSLGDLDGAGTTEEVAERARRGRDRALPACPLMHGAAQWVSLATLFAGGTVVLDPEMRLDAHRLARLLAVERVTVITVVGDAVGRPLADALMELAGGIDVSSVRVVINSGAFLSPPVKDALLGHLSGAVVYDTFGSSESGTFARTVSGRGETPAQGRFTVSEHAAVLDDDLAPVAPGSERAGRLARSGGVALGYYNDPEKSAATFPVIAGVRWCVTGDHATVDADGTIVLLGRGSACINTGGEKVYPDEVEAALKSHPGIADAMVVGLPDERFGQRVVALVVPRSGGGPPDDLDAHVRRRLAGYKAPRAVVTVDAIERFPSGKPDYGWGQETALSLAASPPRLGPTPGSPTERSSGGVEPQAPPEGGAPAPPPAVDT